MASATLAMESVTLAMVLSAMASVASAMASLAMGSVTPVPASSGMVALALPLEMVVLALPSGWWCELSALSLEMVLALSLDMVVLA
jgi:hypothetical protein